MADGEKYVVHGMKAKCSEGSMENYINTDKGHGVVYQGQPVLNANDHVKEINLTHFGDCKSKLIFEEAKKQADEKYKAEEGDGFFGKLGKGIAKTVTKAVIDTKEIFASNKCELDTPLPWIFTSRDHMIDGAPALTVESQCPCKFGGTISIVLQEEEAAVEAEEFRQAVVVDAPKVVPMSAAVGKSDADKIGIPSMVAMTAAVTEAKRKEEERKKKEEKKKKDKKGKGNADSALEKAILLTASFEGSGYVNVTGNFDGAGLSIGIFQWNIGQGTLQPMLKQFFDNNPDLAKRIFGGNYRSVVNMLSASKSAQMDWARSINNGKKLQTEWYNLFISLCKTSQFQKIQREAMKEYTDQANNIANTYGLKSERGLALALDIAVQNWDVSAASRTNIKNRIKNGATKQQVLQLLAQAAVDKADSTHKADVRSRKFTIVNGTGTVHDTKYNLEKDYGITDATFK